MDAYFSQHAVQTRKMIGGARDMEMIQVPSGRFRVDVTGCHFVINKQTFAISPNK